MTKTVLIIVLLVIAALIATKRILALLSSSEEKSAEQSPQESSAYEIQSCEKCSVGKKSYEVDSHSEACPYLEGREGEECSFFVPLESK